MQPSKQRKSLLKIFFSFAFVSHFCRLRIQEFTDTTPSNTFFFVFMHAFFYYYTSLKVLFTTCCRSRATRRARCSGRGTARERTSLKKFLKRIFIYFFFLFLLAKVFGVLRFHLWSNYNFSYYLCVSSIFSLLNFILYASYNCGTVPIK